MLNRDVNTMPNISGADAHRICLPPSPWRWPWAEGSREEPRTRSSSELEPIRLDLFQETNFTANGECEGALLALSLAKLAGQG
jgi:hypothetical protein